MKNVKGKIILVTVLIFVLSSVVIVIALNRKRYNQNNENANMSEEVNTTELAILDDYNIYFSLKEIIENYYDKICNYSYDDVILLLDKNYIKENNVNKNNYYDYTDFIYYKIDYIIKDAYYKKYFDTYYYFLNGDTFSYSLAEAPIKIDKNVSFIVKINNNIFSIIPLNINQNFKSYINNYKTSNEIIELNKDNSFNKKVMSTKNIYDYYLSYFSIELMEEPENAYDLLDEKMKNKYKSANNLIDDKFNIYEIVSGKRISYKSNKNIVTVSLANGHSVEFTENGIMNFKVNID